MESITDFKLANIQLQEDVFDYFEKLLNPKLTAKWRVIVKEECEGVNYVSLSGTCPVVICVKLFKFHSSLLLSFHANVLCSRFYRKS